MAFQTTKNFSNLDIASKAVRGSFAVGPVSQLVGDAYWAALLAPTTPMSRWQASTTCGSISLPGCMERLAQRHRSPALATTEATNVVGQLPRAPGFRPPRLPA